MKKSNVLPLVSLCDRPDQRRVLLFQTGGSGFHLMPDIGLGEWDFFVVADIRQAFDFLDKNTCHVGLVQFGKSLDAKQLSEISGLLDRYAQMQWIALLARETLQNISVCRLLSDYFHDYHTLPLDSARLINTLGHAYGMVEMARRAQQPVAEKTLCKEMVGGSPAMQVLFRTIQKIAVTSAAVLIRGESGTGKELTALALHKQSARANGPFVAVNCGALPSNLVQSTLFGYEKGAFTGANQRKIGSIEAADGGTIFLDEIGDLPHAFQVNLLRFLQEKTITRVGGTESVSVNTRVVAATHVDLEKAVAEGRFREDLYYRLNVLQVQVPALRERKEDIPLLAQFFFEKFRSEGASRLKGFSQQALHAMSSHNWPGNVRELVNRIRRAAVMSEGRLITPADLELDAVSSAWQLPTLEEARAVAEKEAIDQVLKHVGYNLSQAARHLGISRVTLYRLIERYGIDAH